MRRFYAISASFLLLASLFLGCTRQPQAGDDDKKQVKIDPPKVKVDPANLDKNKKQDPIVQVPVQTNDEKQEKYEAALSDALTALAERKWTDALVAFETARSLNDTEFVQGEIARLKARIEQDTTAKSTVKDIETVLNDGKADDALKLVSNALKEFGDGDDADELIKLRLQAEALKNAGAKDKEDPEARYQRFRKEGEAAMEEKNLRAAALAYEQALQARDDAGLQTKYDDIRGKLDTYDMLRKKAAELRRDPTQLEEALEALKTAFAAWETLQVRNEMDELQLALQNRRETVSVVNFEVRNDVGLPNAGAVFADELFPRLKPKFNLVDRNQLNRVLTELQAPQNFVDDPQQQQQVGKLAKVRYLVVGSVSRLVGVTVRARLIDVRTGLVVQTGKIVAPTIQEAIERAPELAKQLLMSDAEKMQFDAQQDAAKAAVVAPADGEIPQAPQPPAAGAAPPPPPAVNVAPPGFGNAKFDAFKRLAPPPAGFVAPEVDPLQRQQRNRLLFATIEIGDFLFRARRFGEAQRQFEFALQLAPDNVEIQLRLERVRPFSPPIVIVDRPRIAVLPFAVYGDPRVVPPSLGYWTPSHLAPYFGWRYEVVDPSEIYWYMGRMGLTIHDLMEDPNARRWLGRATGVRYIVLGALVQTTSFDVNTYLLDTEFGFLQGSATINVRDPFELKLRLNELAQVTMMSPAERAAYYAAQEQQRFERLVLAGRIHMDQGRYREALREFEQARALRPFNIQVQVWLNLCAERVRFQDFILAQNQRNAANQAAIAAARQRQHTLAHNAELARRQAAAAAAARSEDERRVHLDLRLRAQGSLITQAQVALNTNRFGISVSLFRSATDIVHPASGVAAPPVPAAVYQDFARARLKADQAAKLREAELAAARENTLRKVREQQLADAQKALEAERLKSQAALAAARAAQAKRDEEAYKAGLAQGQRHLDAKKYEAALAAFQGAQRLKHTTVVERLIERTVELQAIELGKTNQAKLDAERARREAAQLLAKQNDASYKLALKAGQSALATKDYETAQAKFEEAGKLFKTDAVLAGLKQIESARAAAAADAKKAELAAKKEETIKQLLAAGNAALAAKKYGEALQAFQQAKKLAPDNLQVLAGLTQAEAATKQPKTDPTVGAKAKLQDYLTTGLAALKTKNYDAAEKALRAAGALDPTNATVVQGLRDVAQGRKALADAKQLRADYQAALSVGQKAMLGKNYEGAIASFQRALKLMPDDPGALKLLEQAQQGLDLAAKGEENFKLAIDAGEKAMLLKNYKSAVQSFTTATKLNPTDARARKLLAQAQNALTLANQQAANLANFQKAMTAGEKAMTAKNYKLAVQSFLDATKLDPDDARARNLLAQARQALTDSTKTKTPDPAKQFNDAMQRGADFEKDKKYSAAVKAYQEALKLRPKDADARAGLNQNQFSLHLVTGQQYLKNKMFMAAQFEAEAALRIFANNAEAKHLLESAKKKGK